MGHPDTDLKADILFMEQHFILRDWRAQLMQHDLFTAPIVIDRRVEKKAAVLGKGKAPARAGNHIGQILPRHQIAKADGEPFRPICVGGIGHDAIIFGHGNTA